MFNAQLHDQAAKKLNLTAAYKFNDRDNRTPVNIYQYADAGEAPAAQRQFPGRRRQPAAAPWSRRTPTRTARTAGRPTQSTFDADYARGAGAVDQGRLRLRTHRRAPARIVDRLRRCGDHQREHAARRMARERRRDLSARVGYAYSARRAPNYNENAFLALVPYANVSPATATGGATALSFMNANGVERMGTRARLRRHDRQHEPVLPEQQRAGQRDVRQQQPDQRAAGHAAVLRGGSQSRQGPRARSTGRRPRRCRFSGGVDLNKDDYPDSTYGVQNAQGLGREPRRHLRARRRHERRRVLHLREPAAR